MHVPPTHFFCPRSYQDINRNNLKPDSDANFLRWCGAGGAAHAHTCVRWHLRWALALLALPLTHPLK